MKETDRTWVEIDLDAIKDNYRELRARLRDGTRFLGVVKANAYGHGALAVARVLEGNGCEYLATATLPEALELWDGGLEIPVLILGYTPPCEAKTLAEHNITQAVSSLAMARELSESAVGAGVRVRVHLKADSGMGRFGAVCREGRDASAELLKIMELPGLDVEGIFTHFAVSEEPDDGGFTRSQFKAFTELADKLETISGRKFKIKHCANSGAMVNYTEMQLDMARPGIALYGCYPGKTTGGLKLREAMSLKTRIAQIKELERGDTVSYGRTFTARTPRRVAVIQAGYADGLHRAASGKLEFLLHGRRVPQIGRICMDLCMIDVTDVPDAAVGDIVTIFGRDGSETVSIEELAAAAGTISYEIMCSVSRRVPRIYP